MGSESKSRYGSGCVGGEGQEVAQGVPATAKKVVQSVKEIVNCTEQEIYAVLKECDMDPNRAVERLLAQGTFHEVRSKRERRKEKEMKEALDSRTRSNYLGLGRGGKAGTVSDRSVVQSGLTHVTYNEHGKAVDNGEVGSVYPSVTCSTTHVLEKRKKSDYFSTDNGRQSLRTDLGPHLSLVGANKGHLSMGDIVRMGRTSQDVVSDTHYNIPGVSAPVNSDSSLTLHSQNHLEQQIFHDEWHVIEQPITGNSQALNMSASIANGSFEHSTLHRDCELDAAQLSLRNVGCDNVISEKAESDSAYSNHTILRNDTGLGTHSKSNLKNISSSDFRGSYEPNEDLSPVASDFQRLSVRESKMEVPSSEDSLTVVIPNHLQALAADCSHLSFGTYNSGSNSASSAILSSNNLPRSGLEEKSAAMDSSAQFLDPSSANIGDKHQGFDVFRGTARDENHNFLSSPHQEHVKHIVPEETLEHEYNVSASISDPRLLKSHWVTPSLPMKQPDLQTENHPTFPREPHADSNSVAGDALAFRMSQSQPARYSNALSSIGDSVVYPSEVMQRADYAVPNRSALSRDITEQSSIHFQQLPDIEGYQSLPQPQNKSFMTAINAQQAFSGNTRYNQSSADMEYNLQQNRNDFLTSRLPPATARDAFGFGNPNSSFQSPGSFLSMSSPSLGYMMPSRNFDEILPSQYSGGHNLSSIQRHGNISHWDYGAESRSLPIQEKTQPNFLGQPSQAFPSQYVNPGYTDLYHSQTRVLEGLQQPDDYQDLLSKQLHKFWQQGR